MQKLVNLSVCCSFLIAITFTGCNNNVKDTIINQHIEAMRSKEKTSDAKADGNSSTHDTPSTGNSRFSPPSTYKSSEAKSPFADGDKAGDRVELVGKLVETLGGGYFARYVFRWCPPGTFMMGSPVDEEGRNNDERQHEVTLSRGFWIMETEVTQHMWKSEMGNNPSRFDWGNHSPVEQVSWNDCQEYIRRLCIEFGCKFALPTEAQWEYACRAGTTTAYNRVMFLKGSVNFDLSNTQSVLGGGGNGYPANAWGLYEMHGNVWEWCADGYRDYPSGAVTDPVGAGGGSPRVIRGGGFNSKAEDCRSARREAKAPTERFSSLGFRLVVVSE